MPPITKGLRHVVSACLLKSSPATPTGIEPIASSQSSIAVVLQLFVVPASHAETLRDDLHPVAEEIEQHGDQRPEVQHDIEIEPLCLPAEQPGGEVQMRGTADRQKFGKPLDDGQDDDLDQRHEGSE